MAIQYKQTMYVPTSADLPAVADDGQLAFLLDTQSTVSYAAATASWVPLGRQMVFKSSVTVDGKATASTDIFTLPKSPLYFYPTGIITRAVEVVGAGTAPVMTIGTNSTSYNNIASSGLINSVLGLLDVNNGSPMLATFSPGLSGEAHIFVKVTTGALLFSKYSVKFDILGFYDTTTP